MLMLALLAAAAHAARPGAGWRDAAWFIAPFLLVFGATRWIEAQAEWVGAVIALAAAWRLVRGGSTAGALLLAGLTAGLAAALYAASGMNVWVAAAIGLVVPGVAILLARDECFAFTSVRDGVLLVVAWCAPVIAVTPGVLAGWGSARALNQLAETAAMGIPVWAWLVPVAALLTGGIRGFWVRK